MNLRLLATVPLAMILTLGVATAAHGDTIPTPGAPSPVNILPSTVRGSLPLTGVPGQQQYLATLMYSYARTPEFWAAARAQAAGTATAGQITLVQQKNGSFGVPATRSAGFLKTVGGGGTAITGYSMGTAIGAGTLDLLGFDAQGAVCANTTGVVRDVVALVTGQDCSGFQAVPDEFVPNAEVTAGAVVSGLCTVTTPLVSSGTTNPGLQTCSAGMLYERSRSGSPTVYGPWQEVGYLYVTASRPTSNLARWEVDYTVVRTATVSPNPASDSAQVYAYCRDNDGVGLRQTTGSYNLSGLAGGGLTAGQHTVTVDWSSWGTCPMGPALAMRVRGPVTGTANGTLTGQTVADPGQQAFYLGGTMPPPPEVAAGDPLRTLRCVVVHSGGTVSRDSAPFRESEGVVPQVLCPDITGLEVESIEVREVNLDDGTWLTLYSESTTPEYQAARELAPECSGGTCLLDLRLNGESCFQAPGSCVGWFTDPNKESKYSCHYGTHAVDLAECTIYAPTFQPGATTTGNLYGDPTTGVVMPSPTTLTGSDPSGQGQACWPSGWSVFNPLEWVFRPIVCAFTPSPAAVTAVQTRIDTAIATSQPGTIANTIAGADWSGITSGGCQGILIDTSWLKRDAFADADFPDSLTIANACPGSPLEPYAMFSSLIIGGGVIVACIRTWPALLAKMFNYSGVDGS